MMRNLGYEMRGSLDVLAERRVERRFKKYHHLLGQLFKFKRERSVMNTCPWHFKLKLIKIFFCSGHLTPRSSLGYPSSRRVCFFANHSTASQPSLELGVKYIDDERAHALSLSLTTPRREISRERLERNPEKVPSCSQSVSQKKPNLETK